MRKFYYLNFILWLIPFGLLAQTFTAEEQNEIEQAHYLKIMAAPIQNTLFGGIDLGGDGIMESFVPTAGATETFNPAAGDRFYDTGGAGGSPYPNYDGPGDYTSCGCVTRTTLAGVSEIKFHDFAVFATFDWLRIYDGTDNTGTKLYDNSDSGANSGDILLSDLIASHGSDTFTSASGNFHFEFNASTVVAYAGWDVEIMSGEGGGGGTEPCSQDNLSNNFENGTPNSLYGTANDLQVLANTSFTLEQIVTTIIVPTGSTITHVDLTYFDNSGSNLPGTQIGSQMSIVPTSQNNIGTPFGMVAKEVVLDITPFEFTAGGADTTFWIQIHSPNSVGTASYWEATSASVQGNLAAGFDGSIWSYPSGWAGLDGVYEFNGTCSGGSTEPGEDCEQDFFGEATSGIGFSDGYMAANDIVVEGGAPFTMQTVTFEVACLSGEPNEFDLEIFTDNGSGGVGTSTGQTVHFDSSNMTFVPNGLLFGFYPQFTVTLNVPDIVLADNAGADARYWLAIEASLTTTNDWSYWVSQDYVANPDSYPTMQNDGATWFEYGDGFPAESTMNVAGICGGDEPPPPGEDCEQDFFGEATSGIGFSDGYMAANDIVVEGGAPFTMQTITIEVACLSGEPNEFDLEIFNDNGSGGVGTSTGQTVHFDSSNMTFVPNGLLFGFYPQFTVTLNVPDIVLADNAGADARYWLAIEASLTTTNDWSYWVSQDYVTNPDSYPTMQNDGATWFEYGDGFPAEGTMNVAGICGGDEPPPPGEDCEQDFFGEATSGVGFSDGYMAANDIVVEGGAPFTMQTITIEVACLSGEPNEFDLEIFNDNGSGGVGTSTGQTVHFDSSNMTFVPNGLLFGFYPQYTVTLTVPDIVLADNAGADARYWLAIEASLTTTNDWSYWVSQDYITNPDSYPTMQNDGATWFEYGDGFPAEGTMNVAGICGGDEPTDGCEWTITVSGSGFGDEVSWEFRDANGDVVLSGGPYLDLPYTDTQTINAQDPVEFYIETMGEWGDNSPSFTIENENGVILSGTAVGGTETTYSNLLCSDMPPPPPADCEDHDVLDNAMENAYFFTANLAIDIPVGENNLTLEGAFITVAGAGSSFNFVFYDDNGGMPGNQVDTATGTIIGSEVIGQNFGYDFIKYNIDFDATVNLNANTTYWMQVQSDAVAWDWTSDSTAMIGNPGVFDNGTGWTNAEGGEFVYSLYCEEMGLSDELNSFDFAYYPNPVKDVLNIESKVGVQTIEVYNLVGQKVLSNMQIANDQVNLSSLTSGTYVFRVTLENGQIETFKIIKR